MAQRGRVETEGSRHHETRQQPGGGRSQPARTTTPHREPAAHSRRACRPPPRCQIAPLIWLLDRMLVIGGVAGVDRGGSVTSQQCREGLIDEGGVGESRPRVPCTAEEFSIDGRAQAYAVHATIMPLSWLAVLRRLHCHSTPSRRLVCRWRFRDQTRMIATLAAPSRAAKSSSWVTTGSPRDAAIAAIHRSLIRTRRPASAR